MIASAFGALSRWVLDFTYEVTGFYRFGDAVRDLTDSWTDFPEQWPWLVRTR